MRKIMVMLILLLNISLIAQPAFAESTTQQEVVFQEKIPGYDKGETLNMSNELPRIVGMDDGIYIGPEYPFVLYKLSGRDTSQIWINFTYNFTTQDIVNGAWKWKLLIPVRGNIKDFGLKLDGAWIVAPLSLSYSGGVTEGGSIYVARWDITNFKDLIHFNLVNNTKYGEVVTMMYPLFPQKHRFSVYINIAGDFFLHFTRETEIQTTTTIIQHKKIVFNNSIGIAFDFLNGFGDRGMGGMRVLPGQVIHMQVDEDVPGIAPSLNGNITGQKYVSITFPVFISQPTSILFKISYENGTLGWQNEETMLNLTTPGFQYILISTAHRAYHFRDVFFEFENPAIILFCTSAQNNEEIVLLSNMTYHGEIWSNYSIPHESELSKWIYLSPLGIVLGYNYTDGQYAYVTRLSNVTIYNFGFADVKKYTTGKFIITQRGTYTTWKVYKNVTIKSLGAKIEEDIFGHGTEGGDILTVISNTLRAGYNTIRKIWDFLKKIGNIFFAVLMKFKQMIVNMFSWLSDSAGLVLNYLLYIAVPVLTMIIISYTARWAKGLRATDEGVKK